MICNVASRTTVTYMASMRFICSDGTVNRRYFVWLPAGPAVKNLLSSAEDEGLTPQSVR